MARDVVSVSSPDGSHARLAVPFPPLPSPDLPAFVAHLARPGRLGVVLVRKSGFAVAALVGGEVEAAKVGRRHVQGRSKAGGWSQQRFARRRDQQAGRAYDAAADEAAQLLGPLVAGLDGLVTAGDRTAVSAVLASPALASLLSLPRSEVSDVHDTGRRALDEVVRRARSVHVEVHDPTRTPQV